jgi:hypothetical protein
MCSLKVNRIYTLSKYIYKEQASSRKMVKSNAYCGACIIYILKLILCYGAFQSLTKTKYSLPRSKVREVRPSVSSPETAIPEKMVHALRPVAEKDAQA